MVNKINTLHKSLLNYQYLNNVIKSKKTAFYDLDITICNTTIKMEKRVLCIPTNPDTHSKIRSYMAYCTDDPVAFTVQQKCVNHYLKSNLDEKLIDSLRLQEEEKVSLVESIMEKSLGELSLIPENSKYLVYAGWGMISGAMELMMDNRFNSKLLDEELYFKAVEQIFLSGIPTVSS